MPEEVTVAAAPAAAGRAVLASSHGAGAAPRLRDFSEIEFDGMLSRRVCRFADSGQPSHPLGGGRANCQKKTFVKNKGKIPIFQKQIQVRADTRCFITGTGLFDKRTHLLLQSHVYFEIKVDLAASNIIWRIAPFKD